ncbi:MAG TPA: helix-turn-helix domain-containing protein [Xanthobacteraceae bacterium]|nr:helix-turn-helix domain-containing protein [Xanthobacteraceae bacterium]
MSLSPASPTETPLSAAVTYSRHLAGAPAAGAPEGLCAIAAGVAAAATDVAPADILGLTRGSSASAEARALAMYLAHVGLGLTLMQVGRGFGRHHSTVAHACRSVEDLRDDGTTDRRLDRLEEAARYAARGGRLAR